jgi:hypothetical protein
MDEEDGRTEFDYIADPIKEAMTPFRPVDLTIYVEDGGWRPGFKKVRVKVKNLPLFTFTHMLDMKMLQDMRDPSLYLKDIGEAAKEAVLALPHIEIEAHIKVGEN